jgi:hypothetical protein
MTQYASRIGGINLSFSDKNYIVGLEMTCTDPDTNTSITTLAGTKNPVTYDSVVISKDIFCPKQEGTIQNLIGFIKPNGFYENTHSDFEPVCITSSTNDELTDVVLRTDGKPTYRKELDPVFISNITCALPDDKMLLNGLVLTFDMDKGPGVVVHASTRCIQLEIKK